MSRGTIPQASAATGPARTPTARFAELDWIKAVGAVFVVLGHSIRTILDPRSTSLELALSLQLHFTVAGFLAVSGFLYASRTAHDAALTARRLRRIAAPYLVASLAAQLYRMVDGRPFTLGGLIPDLLLGASFGPYYYVFHIALLTLAAPAVARLPRRALAALTIALVAAQLWLAIAGPLFNAFWEVRNPLRWWAFFMVGCWIRPHFAGMCAWLAEQRGVAWGSALAVIALASLRLLELPPALLRSVGWLETWCLLGFLLAATSGRPLPGTLLPRLSESGYALYLFHLFPVYAIHRLWPPAPGLAGLPGVAGVFAASLALTFAFTEAARAVLGPRARDWLGA